MVTPEILADIWECAADMHGAATDNIEAYKGYSRESRERRDLAIAQRVMDWVTEVRKQQPKVEGGQLDKHIQGSGRGA